MSCDLFEELEDVPIDDLKAPLSLGPKALLHGKLANGITYYIRQSIKPKHRIAVALAVKVGSVNEEEHERGLAHIIEHLAFNATEKMHGHDIVKFLESIGAEFGACQNAYTSSDETVYELLLPSEDGLDHLKSCVEVLSQFAFSIRSSASDLEKERGAVIEEWRQNQDATGRASEAHWKLILKGSRYADRLPIGLPSVIRNVSCDVVKSFYHRHYHPHRMAVCIVGDFGTKSVSEVLDLLNSSDLARNPERLLNTSPIRLNPNFIPHFDPRVAVLVDGESSQGSLYVSFKFKKKTGAWSCSDLLESMCETLFEFCLSSRLFKLARLPDPPFATASISASEPLTATINVRTLSAMLLENKVLDGQNPALRALECLLTEAARVRLHGFKEEEIERAMRSMKSEICQTYRERNEGHATDIRDEYLRHFLSNEIVLGQELEARLYKTLLPRVTKEAIEAVAARFKTHDSCVVKVVEHQRTVNEDAVRALIQKVEAMERQGLLGPFEHHSLVPDHLISPMSIPSPGLISFQETRYGSLGVITEMRLQNGLRVCHKFSDLKEDEVLISGFAFGGLSEVPQDLFITASLTTAIASQLGALGFKPSVLQDVLAGKKVQVDIHQSAFLRYFSGSSTPGDILEVFQLLHLLFTSNIQQVDEEELAVVMRLVKQNLEAQMRSPGYEYSNRVKLINYGDCYYWRPIEVKDLDQVDLHLACAFHNINFRNPGEFTVVISGNITLEQVTPLISQYLASIPATPLPPVKLAAEVTALPFSYPSKPIIEDVAVEMVNEIASQQITIPVVLNRPEARVLLVWLSLAVRIIEARLMQRMRFEFGDVYTVQVSSFFGCDAPSNKGNIRGDVAITFTCDPVNRERLAELALSELDQILSDPSLCQPGLVPIGQEELDTAALLESLAYKESEGELSHWHSLIYQSYQSKSLPELGSIEAVYDKNMEARSLVLKASLTPQAMFDALRDIFPPPRSRYTVVRMVPKRSRTSYLLPAVCTALVICGISAFFLARGRRFRG